MLPAPSMALARNKLVLLSGTEAVRPGEANWAAEPMASRTPVQLNCLYRCTVEPAWVVPFTLGELLLAGELGSVSVICGGAGASESST